MTWKRIKIGLWIALGLIILVPIALYVSAIDLSKRYSAKVEALPVYDATEDAGTYKLKANGWEFKARIAGLTNTGDNVILLHGFPQTSKIWEPIMGTAAAQGYRVLAFDQRGYSPGARPIGKEHYDVDFLVKDLLALADEIGFDTFHLVGHDWGSSVGWKTTMDHPDRILTWTSLSIPHIGVFQEALKHDPEQQKRSSYMSRLRTPILPEFLFVLNRDKMLDRVTGIWREEEIVEVKALFAEHGALSAALNWYRAAKNSDAYVEKLKKKIIRPTLYIWGNEDQVIAPNIIPLQKTLIEAPYTEVELNSGHSLVQEQPEKVTELLLRHWESSID